MWLGVFARKAAGCALGMLMVAGFQQHAFAQPELQGKIYDARGRLVVNDTLQLSPEAHAVWNRWGDSLRASIFHHLNYYRPHVQGNQKYQVIFAFVYRDHNNAWETFLVERPRDADSLAEIYGEAIRVAVAEVFGGNRVAFSSGQRFYLPFDFRISVDMSVRGTQDPDTSLVRTLRQLREEKYVGDNYLVIEAVTD